MVLGVERRGKFISDDIGEDDATLPDWGGV